MGLKLKQFNDADALVNTLNYVQNNLEGKISYDSTNNKMLISTSIQTSQTIQVNLASTASVSLDGTNITPGVTGILPVANGGTGTNSLANITVGTANAVNTTVASGSTGELVKATMGNDDYFRIAVGGSADAGYAEIATADNGNEPIYVRQYGGEKYGFTGPVRTATLLDASGNTSFPGTVTAPTFSGSLSGNATSATTATTANSASKVTGGTVTLTGDVTGSASFNSSGNVSISTTAVQQNILKASYPSLADNDYKLANILTPGVYNIQTSADWTNEDRVTPEGDNIPGGTNYMLVLGGASAIQLLFYYSTGSIHFRGVPNKNVEKASKWRTVATRDWVQDTATAAKAKWILSMGYVGVSTAASTQTKVAAAPSYGYTDTLTGGERVLIRASNTNTATDPKLNVNSTGAHYMVDNSNNTISSGYWIANRLLEFVYTNATATVTKQDGSTESVTGIWRFVSASVKPRSVPLPIEEGGTGQTTAATARKGLFGTNLSSTGTYLIGITNSFENGGYISQANAPGWLGFSHGNCTTAAGTAAKVAAGTNFILRTGAWCTVKFTKACTATSPTLNVNGTGAKPIFYNNAALGTGVIAANTFHMFVYDGTNWNLIA